MGHRVAVFNPASNVNQVSRLQVINPCDEAATVRVKGIDDSGASPGTAVEFTVLPDASRMVTSRELESGQGAELVGMLDACMGKWQLVVTSDEPVEVMSLMTNPTGHLTNVSTEPVPGAEGGGAHAVPLFAAAADTDGEVSIEVYDDVGMSFMPVILDVDARETVHVNTGDLEDGNPTKGLAEGIGAGAGVGDWRLALHSSSRCSPTTGLMTGCSPLCTTWHRTPGCAARVLTRRWGGATSQCSTPRATSTK